MKDTPETKDKNEKNNDQNENDNDAANHDNPGGKQGDVGQLLSMTQSALDSLINERVRRAKSSAVSEYNVALGVDNKDQALAVLEADKKAKEAEMSEIEKLQAQNTTLEAANAKQSASFNSLLVDNAVLLAAPKLDVPTGRIPVLLKLMDTSTLGYKDGAVSGVEDAIKKVLEDNPFILFTESSEDDKKRLGDQGTPKDKTGAMKKLLDQVNRDDNKRQRNRRNSI